jgi:hypothetical protein
MKPNNEAVGDTNAAPRIIHGVSIFVVSNSTKHTSAIAIVSGPVRVAHRVLTPLWARRSADRQPKRQTARFRGVESLTRSRAAGAKPGPESRNSTDTPSGSLRLLMGNSRSFSPMSRIASMELMIKKGRAFRPGHFPSQEPDFRRRASSPLPLRQFTPCNAGAIHRRDNPPDVQGVIA